MKLLERYNIGDLRLKNRMAMSPMTRNRVNEHGIIYDNTVTYYVQRSTAGLIISEGVYISEQAVGTVFTPGIFSDEQIRAWEKVTSAVHNKDGKIFLQLWHPGRVGHSIVNKGKLPVAPSAIRIEGHRISTPSGFLEYEIPKALTTTEVREVIKDYCQAAENAKIAGFDGVELHSASGYLPNQFLVESANVRADEYGGSIENRCRFVLEVMNGLISVWGKHHVGIKLSPSMIFNDILDPDPVSLFNYLIGKLNGLPLAYLHLRQPVSPDSIKDYPQYPRDVLTAFGHLFDGTIIANGNYDRDSAESEITSGRAQMVSFGKLFLANSDLPRRLELNAPLNQPDRSTFYGGGDKGYIDYPLLHE